MLEEDDDDMEGYEPVPNAFDAFIEMSCTIKDAINEARNPLSEQEKAEQLIAAMTPQSEVCRQRWHPPQPGFADVQVQRQGPIRPQARGPCRASRASRALL